jgi:hypothetical protein
MRGTQNLISHCVNFKHCLLASITIVDSFVSILVKTYCLSMDSVYVTLVEYNPESLVCRLSCCS